MFVGDTFLSCFDRFSAKSVVYGANGTLCGVLGSLGLIAVCVILYYGAVIDYINGDYIQGTYRTLNN